MDYDVTRRVLAALNEHAVAYKVFGAVALNLHGLARATQDLDIFVAPEVANIARLREALMSVFGDPHIDEISADDLLGEYPAVQYVPPAGDFYIDILTRLGELYSYDELDAEVEDFDGVPVTAHAVRDEAGCSAVEGSSGRRGDRSAVQARGRIVPVRKFRDGRDIPEPWQERGPALFRAIRSVWTTAARMVPQRFPAGVYRHRSVEDADAQRERWDEVNFDAFQQRRRRG